MGVTSAPGGARPARSRDAELRLAIAGNVQRSGGAGQVQEIRRAHRSCASPDAVESRSRRSRSASGSEKGSGSRIQALAMLNMTVGPATPTAIAGTASAGEAPASSKLRWHTGGPGRGVLASGMPAWSRTVLGAPRASELQNGRTPPRRPGDSPGEIVVQVVWRWLSISSASSLCRRLLPNSPATRCAHARSRPWCSSPDYSYGDAI